MKSPETTRRSVYESLAEIASSFASPARLKVIQILAQSPRSVEELAAETGESIGNVSQHLQRLAKTRVVACERKGVSRIYRVANIRVLRLWEDFQDLGHELNPMLDIQEASLTDPALRAPLSADKVLREVHGGRATLIDVREVAEATASPVRGAISIPLSRFSDTIKSRELRHAESKPIYVLCRGRYCAMATKAVQKLRKWGYTAYRLRESSFRLNLVGGGEL